MLYDVSWKGEGRAEMRMNLRVKFSERDTARSFLTLSDKTVLASDKNSHFYAWHYSWVTCMSADIGASCSNR